MSPVSDTDRQIRARQAAALAELERHDGGTDADRTRAGRPPLKTESEFHRKAVERGLVRR